MAKPISSRRELIYVLSEAAELEHALCCQYLFAACSLKKHPKEGNVTWPQLKYVQDWTSNLLLVARQEMEHLGLVCNLLAAVGGAPYFRRPNFPQPVKYYGDLGRFTLAPFSEKTIKRFMEFEKPESIHLREAIESSVTQINVTGIQRFRTVLKSLISDVCADGEWVYGEAWVQNFQQDALEFITGWYTTTHGNTGALETLKKRRIELSNQKKFKSDIGLPGEVWSSMKSKTVQVKADTILNSAELALKANLNTASAIPIIFNNQVLAVLVFFYETFMSSQEDQTMVEVVNHLVNTPEESGQPNKLSVMIQNLKNEMYTPENWVPLGPADIDLMPHEPDYPTVGALYRQIRKGILRLNHLKVDGDELFIGSPKSQISNETLGLRPGWRNIQLSAVTDVKSAVKVVSRIIVEGEGTPHESATSHYGRFKEIYRQLQECKKASPNFEPARPVVTNPLTREYPGVNEREVTWITHDFTRNVAELFNAAYETMILMLLSFHTYVAETDADLEALKNMVFMPMMTMLIRPLSEILTQLPAHHPQAHRTAGPSFEFQRDLNLFPHTTPTLTFFRERLQEMAEACGRLSQEADAPQRLTSIHKNLSRLLKNFEHAINPSEEW